MARLYVTEQGARVHLDRGRVVVSMYDTVLASVPKKNVDAITAMGRISITTPVIHWCLHGGCDIAFFSLNGRFLGRLQRGFGKNSPLRLQQVRLFDNSEQSLKLARVFIQAKIRNARMFLQRQRWNNRPADLEPFTKRLGRYQTSAAHASDMQKLRSVEGRCARVYFSALGLLPPEEIEFARRVRRPPVGLFNVLLSLGYSLVTAECASAVEAVGLDPAIGLLHGLRYGRPSLALDLVEEFRTPVAERLALGIVNTRVREFRGLPADVSILPSAALSRYLSLYEDLMTRQVHDRTLPTTIRQAIHRQARRLAVTIRSGTEPYIPFHYR